MKKIIVFFIFVIFTWAVGCLNEPIEVHPELLPLRIGNTWDYIITYFDSTGTIESIDTTKMWIFHESIIDNRKWFFTGFGIYRSTVEGIWTLLPGFPPIPALMYKYPAYINDTIEAMGVPVVLISINESINVPYGNVTTYHYGIVSANRDYFYQNDYFTTGVGLVRRDNYNETPDSKKIYLRSQWQLKSLSLNYNLLLDSLTIPYFKTNADTTFSNDFEKFTHN